MKKWMIMGIAAVLLSAGCSGKDTIEKAGCTLEKDGISLSFMMEEKEGVLSQMQAEAVFSSELAGKMDMRTLKEEQIAELSSSFLTALQLEEGEGVRVVSEMKDKDLVLRAEIAMDSKQAEQMLQAMGIAAKEEATAADIVRLLEAQKASCETN